MSETPVFYNRKQLMSWFKDGLGASDYLGLSNDQQLAAFNGAYDAVNAAIDAELIRTIGKNQNQMLTDLCEQRWPEVFVAEKDPKILAQRAIEHYADKRYKWAGHASPPHQTHEKLREYLHIDDAKLRQLIHEYEEDRAVHMPLTALKLEPSQMEFPVEVEGKQISVLLDLDKMTWLHAKRLYTQRAHASYSGPESERPKRYVNWNMSELPSYNLAAESIPAFDQMVKENLERKPATLLDIKGVAEALGVRKNERNRKSSRDSSQRHHYAELEQLFAQLQTDADHWASALTENGVPPSEVFVTLPENHLRFAMAKPEGAKKWQLAEESLPSVREHLGLAPNMKPSTSNVTAWGVQPLLPPETKKRF